MIVTFLSVYLAQYAVFCIVLLFSLFLSSAFNTACESEKNADIFIASSKDQGNTWTKPTRVNTDQTKTHQFFPWMSVDPKTGVIYIVYYDRSKYTDTQNDVVLAYSTDGGKTFKSETISNSSFERPGQFVFFGDYNNISAYDGKVRPIWTRYDGGKLSIWTALIEKKLKVKN